MMQSKEPVLKLYGASICQKVQEDLLTIRAAEWEENM